MKSPDKPGRFTLTASQLQLARYSVTDLLDDLIATPNENERLIIASTLWHRAADLLLTGNGRWTGGGKWLHRELVAYDNDNSTDYADTMAASMRSAAAGSIEPMVVVITQILDSFGGKLFDGFRLGETETDAN